MDLREAATWHLWFTGYDGNREGTRARLATSPDGIRGPCAAGQPARSVALDRRRDGAPARATTYYMAAEGRRRHRQLLTSHDRVHWERQGSLDVRPAAAGRSRRTLRHTHAVDGRRQWYLFYERGDQGIWLATSTDRKVWNNISDEPVIARGLRPYDGTRSAPTR